MSHAVLSLRDSFDNRNVSLPCDRDNWPIVQNCLLLIRDIPAQTTVELLRRLDYLHQCSQCSAASLRNNQNMVWDPKRIIKRSPFLSLASFIESCLTNCDKQTLFSSTIPFIADRAAEIEKVKPAKPLLYLRQNQNDELELSRPFVASLIASCFLCIMPEAGSELCLSLCPNLKVLFQSLDYNELNQGDKLNAIFHYFEQLKAIEIRLDSLSAASSRSSSYSGASGSAKASTDTPVTSKVSVSKENSNPPIKIIPYDQADPNKEDVALTHCNVLRVHRRVQSSQLNSRLLHCYQPLVFLQVNRWGKPFHAENKLMRVVSIDSYLNGIIEKAGFGKDDAVLAEYPELLSLLTFVESLEDNEALWIEGHRYFPTDRETNSEPEFPPRLCLADPLPLKLSPMEQYSERNMLREINKLYACFLQTEETIYPSEGFHVDRSENFKSEFNHRIHRFAEELALNTIEDSVLEASSFQDRSDKHAAETGRPIALSSWSLLSRLNNPSTSTSHGPHPRRGSHNIRGSRPSLISLSSSSSSSGSRRYSCCSARSNSIHNSSSSSSSSRRSSSVSRKSWDLGLPASSSSSCCSNCGASYMVGPSGEHLPYPSAVPRGSDVALEHHDTIFEETEDAEGGSAAGSHPQSAKTSVGSEEPKPPLTRQFRIESDAGQFLRCQQEARLSDSTLPPTCSSTRNQLAVLLQAPISDSRKWSLSRDLSPNRYQEDASSSTRLSPVDLGHMFVQSQQELSHRSISPYPPHSISPSSQITFLSKFTRRNSSPNIYSHRAAPPVNNAPPDLTRVQPDLTRQSMTRRRSMPTNIRMARFLPISDSAKINWKFPDYLNIKSPYQSKDDWIQSYSPILTSERAHSPRVESGFQSELQSWSYRFISDIFDDAACQTIKNLNPYFDEMTTQILCDSVIESSNQLRLTSLFCNQADDISCNVMASVIDQCHNLHHWAAKFIDTTLGHGVRDAVDQIVNQSDEDDLPADNDAEMTSSMTEGFQDPDLALLEGQLRKSELELDASSLVKLFTNEEDDASHPEKINPLSLLSEAPADSNNLSNHEVQLFHLADDITTTTFAEATKISKSNISTNLDSFADNFTTRIIVDVISNFHTQMAVSSGSSRVSSPRNAFTCASCTKKIFLAEQGVQKVHPVQGVATSNWGCHREWGADPQLKAMLQWIAASVARLPVLLYYTDQSDRLDGFEEIVSQMMISDWTVKDLFYVLQEYRIYVENVERSSEPASLKSRSTPLLSLFEFLIYKL